MSSAIRTLRKIHRYEGLLEGGRPFVVEATLASPAILHDHLCLDSLLAYGVAREELGPGYWASGDRGAVQDIPVPLRRRGCGGSTGRRGGTRTRYRWYVWHGSAVARAGAVGYDVVRVRKRWEDAPRYERFVAVQGRGRIDEKAGPFKAWDVPYPVEAVERLTWHGCGDPAEALRLLEEHCPAVGQKRALGFGAVRAWAVREEAEDRSILGPDGVVARPVPIEPGEEARWTRVGRVAYRPPYWLPERRRMCALPGATRLPAGPIERALTPR